MFNFLEWTKETWTLVIAAIALVQPWLVGVWRRFFKGGSIDIFETGQLEIGYSGLGATVGMHGTLRARDREMFVRSMSLLIVKQKDESKHKFEWAFFRSNKTTIGYQIGQNEEVSVDLPAGFMVTPSQPFRYNILFSDIALFEEVRPALENVRDKWGAHLRDLSTSKLISDLSNTSDKERRLLEVVRSSYDNEFANKNEHLKAYTTMDRLCYWEAGKYQLTMSVFTARPNRQFKKTWSFNLSEEDAQNLRVNVIKVLQELCNQNFGQYYFAYPRYNQHV